MHQKLSTVIDVAQGIILDKEKEIKLAITCFLARGHLLIEDLPGVGKTTLSQVLCKLLGLNFSRVQFTSDLLPSDIIGNMVFNQTTHAFEFHSGPLFSQLVLADELNRTNPRTQSALLEAMEEHQVTVDGKSHKLPNPFIVIATQNPHYQLGTFPLPESQCDRFLMSLEIHFPSAKAEKKIMQGFSARDKIQDIRSIITAEEFSSYQSEVDKVVVDDSVAEYLLRLITYCRQNYKNVPISTRGGIALSKAAKAWAFLDGRKGVIPEDVQAVFSSVIGHRLGGTEGVARGSLLGKNILENVEVPI